MRSRYCAFRAGLVDYIIKTTDPDGEAYRPDIDVWRRELVHHCNQTRYTRLQILDAPDAAGDIGYVTFRVAFTQGDERDGFTEQSEFRRVNGIWLYARGQIRASVSASD